ncbi:MAG: hypothetical protein N0E46_13145, partial [Candidatus Thiodiazotropha taylori]|nr:hypothetical protein [Candidatus Thiodiazotropha taylori]
MDAYSTRQGISERHQLTGDARTTIEWKDKYKYFLHSDLIVVINSCHRKYSVESGCKSAKQNMTEKPGSTEGCLSPPCWTGPTVIV